MKFGEVPLELAEGAILAHSQPTRAGRIRKGKVLGHDDIAVLRAEGHERVVVARPGPGDLGEDTAAALIAQAIAPDPVAAGLRITEASTGRVNLYATRNGVLRLDVGRIEALNRHDPMVTLATLPHHARCAPGTLVATIKIISYAVPRGGVEAGAESARDAIRVAPVLLRDAGLVMTDMGSGAGKGEAAIALRLDRLGMTLARTVTVPHAPDAIAAALRDLPGDLALVLTASATSDIGDVAPAGLRLAGGQVDHFGMPVDPGHLLFLGRQGARHVIGLPGCARSPSLNGADWVLERVACGVPPSAADFASMGVGGLLKEIPARPHPREG